MNEKTIVINEPPKGQPRARVTRWVTYDPAKESKTFIKWMIKEQWQDTPIITGPVEVFFEFFMPIPKSTSKKKRSLMLCGVIRHTKKPDRDNMEKKVLDCMSGIVFADDALSWNGGSRKQYSEHPRTKIIIKWEESDE